MDNYKVPLHFENSPLFKKLNEVLGPDLLCLSFHKLLDQSEITLTNRKTHYFCTILLWNFMQETLEKLYEIYKEDKQKYSYLYKEMLIARFKIHHAAMMSSFAPSHPFFMPTFICDFKLEPEKINFQSCFQEKVDNMYKELIKSCLFGEKVNKYDAETFYNYVKYPITKVMKMDSSHLCKLLKIKLGDFQVGMLQGLCLLDRSVNMYKHKLSFECKLTELSKVTSLALALKIKILKYNIMAETYNEETIPALQKIRHELNQKMQKIQEELDKNNFLLQHYMDYSQKYEILTNEFFRLKKKIEKQKQHNEVHKKMNDNIKSPIP